MAKVLCEYEIRPDDPEVTPKSLEEKIRSNLPEGVQMQNETKEKPLAFGIVSLVAQFIIPERDGAQDELEEYILGIEGVGSLELTFTTRL